MIDSDVAAKGIAVGVTALVIAADWLGKWWEKSHPAKKADAIARATIDIGQVLLNRDEAHLKEVGYLCDEHKAVIEQYEVREINLTAEKGELLRQNAETMRLHAGSLQQLAADRDLDRGEIVKLRDQVGAYREDVEAYKRLHEGCELRMIQLQASFDQQERTNREIVNAMRNQLDTKDRRGYHTAKVAENASGNKGAFTATDVWPEGKPKP